MSKDIKSFIQRLIPSSNESLKEKSFNIFVRKLSRNSGWFTYSNRSRYRLIFLSISI